MFIERDVHTYIAEEDVKFIRLAFSDIFGVQKNLSIMPSELPRAFSEGIPFDASAIRAFGTVEQSELYLFPDPDTLTPLPWRSFRGKVVRFFCDVRYPDASPFALDTRFFLKNAIARAKEVGLSLMFGPEMEFYLFKTDEAGECTNIPYDRAGYFDVAPEDKGENIRREICLTLEEMGFTPETSHHEEGPGQNEIDFKYSDPLSAADHAVTFKTVVKTIAAANGAHASFAPKPLDGAPGNGLHINISIVGGSEEQFMHFMAGIIARIREITLFLNPIPESYKRLGQMKAPKFVNWAYGNRSQLIRIPAARDERKRLELRSPDPSTNPYLAFGLLIHAGVDGVLQKMTLPGADQGNTLMSLQNANAALEALPASLEEAAALARSSEFVKTHVHQRILDEYASINLN